MDDYCDIPVRGNSVRAVVDFADREPFEMEQVLQIEVSGLHQCSSVDLLRGADRCAGTMPAGRDSGDAEVFEHRAGGPPTLGRRNAR